MVLLSKWIHSLENLPPGTSKTDAESEIFARVKTELETINPSGDGGTSLAARVVNSYAPLLMDVRIFFEEFRSRCHPFDQANK